jgi:hypothetical protein
MQRDMVASAHRDEGVGHYPVSGSNPTPSP